MTTKEHVARMYKAGLAYTRIAAETGWNPKMIRQLARELGLHHPRQPGRRQVPCAERKGPRRGCHCPVCRAHWQRINETRGRTRTECAYRRGPRKACTCEHCRAYWRKRDGERKRRGVRQLYASTERPRPRVWRCCGWLQQIPEGETARCQRCGVVPLFARPEPDLRQFRNGR